MKNKESYDGELNIFDICCLIFSAFTIFFIWAISANNEDASNLIFLIQKDVLICAIYGLIPITRKYSFYTLLGTLIFINFLLLFNIENFSFSSGHGVYYIDFFKPASQTLFFMIFFSPFLLCLPIISYAIFLYVLSKFTYYLSNYNYLKKQENINNQKNTKER